MATHVDYDTDKRIIYVTTAPTDGVVTLDVQIDIYSDIKEDWKTNSTLNKLDFPLRPTGGDTIVGTKIKSPFYFIKDPWRFRPYEASHTLYLENAYLVVDGGGEPWLTTEGSYTVNIRDSVPSDAFTLASDTEDVADAVWEEDTSLHKEQGTYGAELATKADLAASTSTSQDPTVSGIIVYGINNSGDYTSTFSRDNTYWEIGEDAVTGITVDMTFNLPSADSRPGVFNFFGRYTGQPALTHHQELWAYNYETVSWEVLQEAFIPGGLTSDSAYSHEYYERHVDRANNNEVKIRIAHHVTNYNASHALYIDYVDVSSIDVVTAEEIATAVWADVVASGLIADVEIIKQIETGRWKIENYQMIFYEDDNVTEIMRFNLFDEAGDPANTDIFDRQRV